MDLLGALQSLSKSDGKVTLGQTGGDGGVISQVDLGSHEDHGGRGAVVANLWSPLGLDVISGGWGDHGEACEEHIGLGIGKEFV